MQLVSTWLFGLAFFEALLDVVRTINAGRWQVATLGDALSLLPDWFGVGVVTVPSTSVSAFGIYSAPLFVLVALLSALLFLAARVTGAWRTSAEGVVSAARPTGTGTSLPAAPSARRRIAPISSPTRDREFLPASLEILATPVSPASTSLMLTICGAVVATLAWSYFSWIDIHAVSPGKLQPSGRSKVVQPLEPGKVVAIRVENGSVVNAGDVLLELDPTETGADREAMARDLEAARAEVARRRAAVESVNKGGKTFVIPAIEFAPSTGAEVRQRETSVLAAEMGQLRSMLASLEAQLLEKQATKQRLADNIEARQKLIALSAERVEMRKEIDARGAGSRALIIEALQQYENVITTNVGERGQLKETDAAIVSLQRRLEEALTQFVADQMQKLAEADRKRDRQEQDLIKAKSRNDRTVLKAPISGTVQQLAVTTVGQVVTSGQSLLTVVPLDGAIEVEALITNRDIGFVEVGQTAVIKVDAFPFTRYGTIDATVSRVSRDAVDDRSATGLSDVSTVTRPQGSGGSPSAASGANLVFPATLLLSSRMIRVDGKEIPLLPGMTVTVEIKTGQRRAIDYVLSPLREVTAKSASER